MKSQLLIRSLMALALVLGMASGAFACPFCDGGPSGTNEVKAAIFGEDFGFNLLATVLPFLAVVGVVVILSFGPPKSQKIAAAAKRKQRPPISQEQASEGVADAATI